MRHSVLLTWLCVLTVLVVGNNRVSAEPTPIAPITLGHSTAPLNGPWRFHVGDDPRWSSADFDDSTWETVDLTPAPDAHDGDVGLPGYVSGWSRRGHAGYTGYAWYRLKVDIDSDTNTLLRLAGPTLVDSTYELYVDGKLLGGSGIFAGTTPTVFGVRPTIFPLPSSVSAGTTTTYLVAFRVWMDPLDAGEDNGGIHVAPIVGDADGIDRLHQVQWLQTFKGYVVDAVEPLAFVLLALMVVGVIAYRTDDAYGWLVIALLLLALLRVHQVLFYWTDLVSLRSYDTTTTVILRPLTLAAWILAWTDWFRIGRSGWLRSVVIAGTAIYIVCALLSRPWFLPEATGGIKPIADGVIEGVRVAFVALYLWIVVLGTIRCARPSTYLAVLAAVLVGIGLFATELNALGIPGIWFPYGTGVARGQYAYAAFFVVLFVLLLIRSAGYAREERFPLRTSAPQ